MLRFGKKKQKIILWWEKATKIWGVDVDSIVISKLIKTENNSRYLIGY